MGLTDLFKKKWQHSKLEVRLKAISEMEDKDELSKLANSDKNDLVRKAAEERLEYFKSIDVISKYSSIHDAIMKEDLLAVKGFINNGADINEKAKDSLGNTPLALAVIRNNDELLRVLLSGGANPSAKNNYGSPAWHAFNFKSSVKFEQRVSLLKILFDSGVNINEKGSYGDTALHYASKAFDSPIVMFLLENGADALVKNDENETALDTATEYTRPMIEGWIKAKKGEKIVSASKDKSGEWKTPELSQSSNERNVQDIKKEMKR